MSNKPKVDHYIDEDEKNLIESIESDSYQVEGGFLTPERMFDLQAIARSTMNEERIPISLRVPKTDLSRLKARAMREGMPYQTLINSILHKAVSRQD
jgi:predicted DNA binding CopG/RHH family protein